LAAELLIRSASASDVPYIEALVSAAYRHYIPRIGKPPGPMTDDYSARVAESAVSVLTIDGTIAGILVLIPKPDCMLLDNVAVSPERQGSGLGRRLIAFAEAKAKEKGFTEIQLYTNAAMHENLAIYMKLGYQEFARSFQDGFHRVFMNKRFDL
jgi:N-acetylglutamate synthase-like GNAT family acetyltransferase